jgi:hypothetical protein
MIITEETINMDSYYGWWWSTNPPLPTIKVATKYEHLAIAKNFFTDHEIKVLPIKGNPNLSMMSLGYLRIVTMKINKTKYIMAIEGIKENIKKILPDLIDTIDHYTPYLYSLTFDYYKTNKFEEMDSYEYENSIPKLRRHFS